MNNLLLPNERLDDLQYNNLSIIQNPNGYCFTSDAVELANFVKSNANANVVELCSGSGVISILVNAKNKINKMYLVEIQSKLASMSERSIKLNNITNIEVINKQLQNISKELGVGSFDIVICNPPYKKEKAFLNNENTEIAIAKNEIKVTLEEIVFEASRLLKFGGKFYTCIKEERFIELVTLCLKYKLQPKEMKILRSKKIGANVILLSCTLGGKSGFKIKE